MLTPHRLDLVQVASLLVGQPVVQFLQLCNEAILLLLGQLGVPLVLLVKLESMLVR